MSDNAIITQRIEEAANKYGLVTDRDHAEYVAKDFTAGANFVINTILPEFAEWLDRHKWFMRDKYNWANAGTGQTATTEQLIELFKNRDNG